MRNMTWILFLLITVVSWGLYGIFLHKGSVGMADKELGRYKAFLLVGIAYFVVAVVAPWIMIVMKGGSGKFWQYPGTGVKWSFIAGVLGAIGAFGVLLSLGALFSIKAANPPAVVMSLVFGLAPVVNALVALGMHPPEGGYGVIKPQFYLGLLCAALGAFLVMKFKPGDAPPVAKKVATSKVVE